MSSFKPEVKSSYALVTGASDRIGRAIALELAGMGYNLVLHYRTAREKAEAVKLEVEALGREVVLRQFDFDQENDFDDLFDDLTRQGIAVGVLVNSASTYDPSDLGDIGTTMWNRQLKANFEGAYLLTKSFAGKFKEGVVINMLDTKITKDRSTHLDYLLSKKLLADFTRMAAVELAPEIRVNGICPGLILPPQDKDETYLQELASQIPLQCTGHVEDICRAVRYIVESPFVTGQFLYVDGGEHLST